MQNSSPFQNSTFTRLFFAQIASLVGTGITIIAIAILAWEMAGDQAGKILGIILALKMFIYVIFSPIITSITVNLSNKSWLIAMDIGRAILLLFLPFVEQNWQVYLILALVYVFSAGFTPVFQSIIPNLFKDTNQYQKALSYARLAYDVEQLLSPLLAAFLLTLISFKYLFFIDAFSFILSGILVATCILPIIKSSDRPNVFIHNITYGITAYLKTPRLQSLIVMYIAVACASAMVIVNTVLYVKEYLLLGEADIAVALAAAGAGSMVAAIMLPGLLEKWKVRNVLLSGILLIVFGLFYAASLPGWTAFLIIWFVIGMGLSIVQIPVGSMIRMSCNESDTTAFFTANFSLSHLCWFGAYLAAGFLSAQLGLSYTFVILGIISLGALFGSWQLYPNPDTKEIIHTHVEATHNHRHEHEGHHEHQHDNEIHPQKPHSHSHSHAAVTHKHYFVLDYHHTKWPASN